MISFQYDCSISRDVFGDSIFVIETDLASFFHLFEKFRIDFTGQSKHYTNSRLDTVSREFVHMPCDSSIEPLRISFPCQCLVRISEALKNRLSHHRFGGVSCRLHQKVHQLFHVRSGDDTSIGRHSLKVKFFENKSKIEIIMNTTQINH